MDNSFLQAKALNDAEKSAADDIPPEIAALAEERKAARKAKDFAKADELRDKITYLRDNIKGKSVAYAWHEPKVSKLESLFARGDRKLSDAIYLAWSRGCRFDGWDEQMKFDVWMDVLADLSLDFDFYATRARGEDEILPWDVIDVGVKKNYLLAGWHDALRGVAWPDCRQQCMNCGARRLNNGICVTD